MNESSVKVLHAVEDVTYTTEAPGASVDYLAQVTGLSATTVRKTIKELEDGGFVQRNGANGRAWVFRAVTKNQEESMPKSEPTADGRGQRAQAQERDALVLSLLPATVDEVAAKLKVKRSVAYVSIWRLHRAGKVAKTATGTRTPVWDKK